MVWKWDEDEDLFGKDKQQISTYYLWRREGNGYRMASLALFHLLCFTYFIFYTYTHTLSLSPYPPILKVK